MSIITLKNMHAKILRSNSKYDAKVTALLHELSAYSEEILNRRPAKGGWSAIQVAWHLLLVEENSMLYVQKKLGYGGSFETVGMAVRWRTFWLLLGLSLPIKYRAPKSSGGDNLPLNITYAELLERWKKSRAVWTEFLSQLPDNLVDKAVYKHPRVGKIGWLQMQDFIQTHFDRHLIQIRKAL